MSVRDNANRPRVVAVVGSTRAQGNTSGLAEKAGDALVAGGLVGGATRLAHQLVGALTGEDVPGEERAAR